MNDNKKLNLISAIFLLVSGMIGSAIFSLSGLTMSMAGPACIISWLVAANIELLYGLAMAELATIYKISGGTFVFPEMTFQNEKGKFLGFMSTWGNAVTNVIAVAFSAMYVGIYLSVSFPIFANYGILISIVVIILCYLLNCIKLSMMGKINMLLAMALAFLLIVYIVTTLKSEVFSYARFMPFWTQGTIKPFGFLSAIPIAMIGYSSIMSVSFMVGDIEKPQKNLPKAVLFGMFIVAMLYLFVVFATLGMIDVNKLNELNMQYVPLFAVCSVVLKNEVLSKVVSIAATIALITTMLVIIAIDGRAMNAMACKNLLPKVMSKENKNGMPYIAMLVTCSIGCVLCFFNDAVNVLVNLGALFSVVTFSINLISFYATRLKIKNNQIEGKNYFMAPIKSGVVFILLFIMFICYMPDIINGGWKLWVFTVIWYGIGFLVYKKFKGNNYEKNNM